MSAIVTEPADRQIRIELPDIFTIAGVADVFDKIENTLESATAVSIDASKLVQIDTAALQLFCVINQELQRRSLSLRWESVPDALEDAAKLSGVLEYTGMSEVPH